MNPFKLAKAAIAKKMGVQDESADTGLPFGARIGSLVTLKISPFLRAKGSLVGMPDASQIVVGVSRLHVDLNGNAYRLYTALGDSDSTPESYLQIYTDTDGSVVEMVYFRRIVRIIPETSEEQDAFLGEDPDGLGQSTFSIDISQMEGLNLGEGVVEEAFASEESIVYVRGIGDASTDFIAPFHGTENRIDDSLGKNGLHQKIVFMPYQRILDGGAFEQLLITTEIVSDRNGDESAREIHVDFMVGLVLSASDVLVQ